MAFHDVWLDEVGLAKDGMFAVELARIRLRVSRPDGKVGAAMARMLSFDRVRTFWELPENIED